MIAIDALLFVIFLLGCLAGAVAIDFKDRKAAARAMQDAVDKMSDGAAKLAETHNKVAAQMQALGDKVAAHDFVIRKGAPDDPGKGLLGRKF